MVPIYPTHKIPIHPGQRWEKDERQLNVYDTDERYVYCRTQVGRHTRIMLRRMNASNGYHLIKDTPSYYVDVPSEEDPRNVYHIWTGDEFSPAHCNCEDFRWATREPGKAYYCKHLKLVLFKKGMS